MKISFLIGSLTIGGAENQLTLLAKGLKKRGHVVSVIVYYKGGELQEDLENAGIPVIVLNKKGRWDIFHFFRHLIKTLKDIQPEILHSYMGANVISVLAKPFISNAKIVWGIRASNMEFKNYHWTHGHTQKLECLLSKYADLIITNSQAGHQLVVSNGFPESQTITIHNGINTDYFKPDQLSRKKMRLKWGIHDNDILIGNVGRLNPMKDHNNFLNAASLLIKHEDNLRFICIGDGPATYKNFLKQQATDLGLDHKIIWAGAHKNMNDVFNGIDILCQSSSGEGFPNVIAEAMSCDTVCVATDVGDSAIIIGDTGVIVPVRSPADLSTGILKATNNKKYWQNNLQRDRILNQFSLQKLIKKTEKTLLELL